MPQVHPSALVDPRAELAPDVVVGPYAIIGAGAQLGFGTVVEAHVVVGDGVRLGNRNRLRHHCSLEGDLSLGDDNEVWPYAYLGQKTQDRKFSGGRPRTEIGHRNVFREYVTVHAATNDGDATRVGDDNLLLAFVHVAHDCVLGNGITISNSTGISGHVVIEDRAVIGGMTGFIQKVRVGTLAMVGGFTKVVQDIPPFMLADGNPAETRMPNKVGLQRAGATEDDQAALRHAHRILYREGLNRSQAVAALQADPVAANPKVRHLLAFIASSEKGIC